MDYHLARARAAAATRATGLRTPVRPAMQALARTMQRLHAGRGVTFDVQASEALAFKGEPQDLYEMLGNLMDNAGKWAARRITAAAAIEGGSLLITVDDDGPGIPAGQRQRIFQRGARLDENRPGSGLGLDIVRDMAETYGACQRRERQLARWPAKARKTNQGRQGKSRSQAAYPLLYSAPLFVA